MKCEICGADATVHITEVDVAGGQEGHHLCSLCAQQKGLPFPADMKDGALRLRTLAAFIRTNNRMPLPDELRQMGGFGALPATPFGTPLFEEQVSYLESYADFLEQHGRDPTEEELHDPFLRRS